jgi:hypothetical protein
MYPAWCKGNNGELIILDCQYAVAWRQYPEDRNDKTNPEYFTCKICRKTTISPQSVDHPQFHEPKHYPGCTHPYKIVMTLVAAATAQKEIEKEKLLNAMLSLQV